MEAKEVEKMVRDECITQDQKEQEAEDWVDKEFFEGVACPECNTQRTEKKEGKHQCNACSMEF